MRERALPEGGEGVRERIDGDAVLGCCRGYGGAGRWRGDRPVPVV